MSIKSTIKNNRFLYRIAKILHKPIYALHLYLERSPDRHSETKSSLLQLEIVQKSDVKIWFCGIPNHKNLGDQAQRYCIEKWLKANYSEYEIVEVLAWPFYNKAFCQKLKKKVNVKDLFVIQSGYCTSEQHYNHYMHRVIASLFPDNPILIMPQTVKFYKEKEGYKTGNIYAQHDCLYFLARDKQSYLYAKKFFKKTKIQLYPDIVTSLIGTLKFDKPRNGVLICVRNDGEKFYTDEQIASMKRKFGTKSIHTELTDTNYDGDYNYLVEHFEDCLLEKLKQFASYQVVITDRYHGTIFSMIANTPVIVLATKDHKVKTGTEWFKGVYDSAYFNASSIEEAISKTLELIETNLTVENSAYFKEKYYDCLKEQFEALKAHGGK